MAHILIAQSQAEFAQELSLALASFAEVTLCTDGNEALRIARETKPDILVVDLSLQGIDGLSLLRQLGDPLPSVLVLTRLLNPYYSAMLELLDVELVLRLPCQPEAVAQHLRDMLALLNSTVFDRDPCHSPASELLQWLGFSVRLDGYKYLQTGLPLFISDPEQTFTKVLYPAIAKIHGTSKDSVERSIRNAIRITWDRRDPQRWSQIMPEITARPSNGRFIIALSQYLSAHPAVVYRKSI